MGKGLKIATCSRCHFDKPGRMTKGKFVCAGCLQKATRRKHNGRPTIWTPERLATLKRLWKELAEACPARENRVMTIAVRMGRTYGSINAQVFGACLK